MDNLQNFRRTDYCGTFSAANVGQEISVCGWVQRQRNLGGLIFVDLRDRTGLIQLSFQLSLQLISLLQLHLQRCILSVQTAHLI